MTDDILLSDDPPWEFIEPLITFISIILLLISLAILIENMGLFDITVKRAFALLMGAIAVLLLIISPWSDRKFTISSEKISFSKKGSGSIKKVHIRSIIVRQYPKRRYVIILTTPEETFLISNSRSFHRGNQHTSLPLERILKAFAKGKYPYKLETATKCDKRQGCQDISQKARGVRAHPRSERDVPRDQETIPPIP